MSKFDYKKEFMDSLKDGAIITGVTLGVFFGLKSLLKTQPPSAKLDGMDALKLFGGIAVRVYSLKTTQFIKNGSMSKLILK